MRYRIKSGTIQTHKKQEKQNPIKISNKIKIFFSNPWVGIVLAFITVIELFIGILSYTSTINNRNLTYVINPVKAVALQNGKVSDLKVSSKGKDIKTDITVIQIAIWNKGKQSIKNEDILKQVKIVASPSCQILETIIRKSTRDIIDFKIDDSHYTEGYIPLSWQILEKNDGVVIQIIYSGSLETDFKVVGVLEGQSNITPQKQSILGEPTQLDYKEFNNTISITAIAIVIFNLIAYFFIFRKRYLKFKKQKRLFEMKVTIIVPIISIIVSLAVLYISICSLLINAPPFGF